ncbi:tetratricopeptide repeat protein [Actinokineospora sp. NBRC 105648]|uniref:tetratricopeptide repeat protein n=1 Tax=Actinokineospora sp. NBRC 105648 TaxID=3032206 RepID=UPI002553FD03|nr:tetratricopeptide repeat protein [Actinokineospora sp. NBRC 105648]
MSINTITGPVVAPVAQARSVGGPMVTGTGNQVRVVEAGAVSVEAGGQVVLPAVQQVVEPLPAPAVDVCIGRDEPVARVVDGWLSGELVAVLGGPGIGKSTVLGRALTEARMVSLFGDRRFVVSCEGAPSADAVVDKLALVLGLVHGGPGLRNLVLAFVRRQPCVLVLDNFETVADADPDGAHTLVRELRASPADVRVGLGYRGGAVPGIHGALDIRLNPLTPEAAVDLFVTTAGEQHRGDPNLAPLVAELDGVPLAIVLLAGLARSMSTLATLRSAWQDKHTALLHRHPTRTSSLPVSIELSWDTLTPDARSALTLAALLPDGWPTDGHTTYLPDTLNAGVIELGTRALLHDDDTRQRCLAPIREHIRTQHTPTPQDHRHLVEKVRTLAAQADRIGHVGGAAVTAELVPEFTNITAILTTALDHNPTLATIIPGLVRLQMFTGLGTPRLAEHALTLAPTTPDKAAITRALAQLYHARADDRARELFNEALPLYRKIGDVLGEANCLSNLGQVEFIESRNDRARELFNRALILYQQIRDRYSQAITHAYLCRLTTGDQRTIHRRKTNQLADEIKLDLNTRGALQAIADHE